MQKKQLMAAAGVAILASTAGPSAALAAPAPGVQVVSSDLGAPFNLEPTKGGVLVADGFPGSVSRLNSAGDLSTVDSDVPGASGVAMKRWGSKRLIAYTTTVGDETGISASGLVIKPKKGRSTTVDTLAYETAHNPDRGVSYGLKHPTQCQTDTLESVGFPVSYTGEVDSHAYSVAAAHEGWVVADAGANALLRVSGKGWVSTLAVLPAQPAPITQEAADAFGLDDCVVGETYAFESVPTDVEVGKDGWLYVTTLPGGPEDAALGARGSVYKVNPHTGASKRVATGFLGATNLALQHGHIYVTELFGNRISMVHHGGAKPVLDLPGAVSVEAGHGHTLWAGTVDLATGGPGTVVKVKVGHHHH